MSAEKQQETAEQVAELVEKAGRRVATAESLTSGLVAQRLGASPAAATWFRGGVVAYHDEVKFGVLHVEEGPVVTAKCAREMAAGVSELLGANLSVSTTGAGGPEGEDGAEPGTVFTAVQSGGRCQVQEHHFDGEPEEVVLAATQAALDLLLETLHSES